MITLTLHPGDLNVEFYRDLYGDNVVRTLPMSPGWARVSDGFGLMNVGLTRPSGRATVIPVMDALTRPLPIEDDSYAAKYAEGVREGLHIHHINAKTNGVDLRLSDSIPYWRGRFAVLWSIEKRKPKAFSDINWIRHHVRSWPSAWTTAAPSKFVRIE